MSKVLEVGKITTTAIMAMKAEGEKISMLTAYDYTFARIADNAGIEVLLVGDSVGMVFSGLPNTLPVTLEQMIYHTAAVSRGAKRSLVVTDMPFMAYQISPEEALRNAGRLIQEANAEAVKIEGGRTMCPTVTKLVSAGIPVMGHIGLTPQSIHVLGGFRVQGKGAEAADCLVADALALQEAGAFAIVLEGVPASLGLRITRELSIPTIGIGAGPGCDGQVLVMHDLLGLFDDFTPKFVKQYSQLGKQVESAFRQYRGEVKASQFPEEKHCFKG